MTDIEHFIYRFTELYYTLRNQLITVVIFHSVQKLQIGILTSFSQNVGNSHIQKVCENCKVIQK